MRICLMTWISGTVLLKCWKIHPSSSTHLPCRESSSSCEKANCCEDASYKSRRIYVIIKLAVEGEVTLNDRAAFAWGCGWAEARWSLESLKKLFRNEQPFACTANRVFCGWCHGMCLIRFYCIRPLTLPGFEVVLERAEGGSFFKHL